MNGQLATSIANLLRHGGSVAISNFEIEQKCMAILSQGLETLAGCLNDSPQEFALSDVRFLHDEGSLEKRTAGQCLVDGLVRNRTLKSFRCCSSTEFDGTAAKIVRSFIGHPSLTKLEMNGVEFGNLTSDAICLLLASPTCKVSDLLLSSHRRHREGGDGFDFERFVDQLPVSTSVQSLDLSFRDETKAIDHDSANQLLRSLWKLPNLRFLKIRENSILDSVRLTNNLTRTNPHSHLRRLNLCNYHLWRQKMSDKNSTRAIFNLLDAFPVLRRLGGAVEKSFPAIVRQRFDLNGCSGMLLRGAEVPLSVWAVVLAKVDTYPFLEPFGKENAIYNMLHGPVFAGRGPLNSRKRQYPY